MMNPAVRLAVSKEL